MTMTSTKKFIDIHDSIDNKIWNKIWNPVWISSKRSIICDILIDIDSKMCVHRNNFNINGYIMNKLQFYSFN